MISFSFFKVLSILTLIFQVKKILNMILQKFDFHEASNFLFCCDYYFDSRNNFDILNKISL